MFSKPQVLQHHASMLQVLRSSKRFMQSWPAKSITISVVAPHNGKFVELIHHLPRPLQSLYTPTNLELHFAQPLELAQQFKEKVTPAMQDHFTRKSILIQKKCCMQNPPVCYGNLVRFWAHVLEWLVQSDVAMLTAYASV